MKFVVAAGPFTDAVSSAVIGVRAHKKKLPALFGAVRLETVDGAVLVTCSNNSMAISARVPAEVIEPGRAATSERLAALGFADDAKITVNSTDRNVAITCRNSLSRLAVQSWDDLPPVLAIEDEIARVEISGDNCRRLLWPLSAAESRNAARNYLCGILLHGAPGDKLVAIATDGAVLMRIVIPVGVTLPEGRDLVLPSLSAGVLAKLLAKGTGTVTLRRSRTLLGVDTPALSLISPLLATQFPAYERVIPEAAPNTASCSRNELIASLDRLQATSTAEAPLVALSWGARGQLDIFLARQPHDGSDSITAVTKGSADVALPLPQLGDMIGNFESERLHLETSEGSPLVIRDDGKLALISRAKWIFGKEEHGAKAVA